VKKLGNVKLDSSIKRSNTAGGTSKNAGKGKNADIDTSFDRKHAVDKITNKVEFIYIPTY
jgi:hypothetical protein